MVYPYKKAAGWKRTSYVARSTSRSGKRMKRIHSASVQQARWKAAYAKSNARSGGFLGIEYKFLDTTWNAVAIVGSTDGSGGELQPSAGCTGCISMPAQGDGESQRDGRKFVITSAHFSGQVNYAHVANSADAVECAGIFFALVLDTQANGATITSEELYINPATLDRAMVPYPLRNLEFSKRFRVLDSKYIRPQGLYSMTDGASTASINVEVAPVVSLSWKGKIDVLANGTTADVANATTNAVHIIAYKGGATFTTTFNGKCRVRFVG